MRQSQEIDTGEIGLFIAGLVAIAAYKSKEMWRFFAEDQQSAYLMFVNRARAIGWEDSLS